MVLVWRITDDSPNSPPNFSCYTIAGKLLDKIELIYRKQIVSIRSSFSDWVNTASGVPQSSVLGPIVFIILVNDMSDVINSMLLMFADDTELYQTIYKLTK